MPTYYFHIRDGDTLIIDDDGQELADMPAVTNEAIRSARDLREQDLTDHLFTSGAPTSQSGTRPETKCSRSRSI